MATRTQDTLAPLLRSQTQTVPETKKVQPVVWWAILGGLILSVIAYVMIRWITGPYFEPVDPGPTQVPDWQKVSLLVIQIGGTFAAIGCLYWFLVRPWRRDGKPTTEGLLALAYGTLYVQDPVSLSGGYWFTYNATMFDMGSWAPYLPFFNAPSGEPGNMLAEPILGMGTGYIYFWIIGVAVAFKTLNIVKKRFPQFGIVGATLCAYAAAVVFDVVLEGLIWMKTGFYHFGGAPGPKLFADETSFQAYPLVEGLLIGLLITPYAILRHYKDDKGYTIVERGIDNMNIGSKSKIALRFLALVAVAQCIYFFCYNVFAVHVGLNQNEWPQAVQERSYFLNGVCGEPNNRLCYGTGNPNFRENSAFINPEGKLVIPKGEKLPNHYPVVKGTH